MAVPSNVVNLCGMKAFQKNAKVQIHTGKIASQSPFEATVAFNCTDGRTIAVKWRMGVITYLG